jgi:predicted metal-binding membrane protein
MQQVIAPSALERLLRRDRAVTLVALVGASLLAWAYILAGAGMDMAAMEVGSMSMPGMTMSNVWTPSYFALMLVMWAIMMVAMMLPSAAPMILLFATIERRRHQTAPFVATAIFSAAYLVVWSAFSVAATLLQWMLDRWAVLSPTMATTSGLIAGAVLIAAGIYQFTPLKQACLRGCRSPLEFISRYWSSGPFGIGLRHGFYCVGCCWVLMLLLFVSGVMNLIWVAVIAVFIWIEKVAPRGPWLGYGVGVLLVGWGLWTLYVHVAAATS